MFYGEDIPRDARRWFRVSVLVVLLSLFASLAEATEPPGTKLWELDTGHQGYVQAAPAVARDGTIYIVAGNPAAELWSVTPRGTVNWKAAAGVISAPIIGRDGTIYVAGVGGIRAYTPVGVLRWFYSHGDFFSDAALGRDGTLYVGTFDTLFAFSPEGILKWTRGGLDISTPVVGTDGTIYVQGYQFHALTPDGNVKWNVPIARSSGYRTWGALGFEGAVYVVGSALPSQLFCIDRNGTLRWRSPVGSSRSYGASAPVIGTDGVIYVGNPSQQSLEAYRPDGTLQWTFTGSPGVIGGCRSPALAADGTIYVQLGPQFYAVDSNGREIWRFETQSITPPAIVQDGTVYVGGAAGLYAFKGTAGPARSPWPMFQRDLQRTGRANASPLPRLCVHPLSPSFYYRTNRLIISVDGRQAEVVFDGTPSSDPEGDPLDYGWLFGESPAPVSTNSVITNSLSIGSHEVRLRVDDGVVFAEVTNDVEIITIADALIAIGSVIEEADVADATKNSLLQSLEGALKAVMDDDRKRAGNLTRTLQRKVQAQVLRKDPTVAQSIIGAAEAAIQALAAPDG